MNLINVDFIISKYLEEINFTSRTEPILVLSILKLPISSVYNRQLPDRITNQTSSQ